MGMHGRAWEERREGGSQEGMRSNTGNDSGDSQQKCDEVRSTEDHRPDRAEEDVPNPRLLTGRTVIMVFVELRC